SKQKISFGYAILLDVIILIVILFLQFLKYATVPAIAPNRFKEDKYRETVSAVNGFNTMLILELLVGSLAIFFINAHIRNERKWLSIRSIIILVLFLGIATISLYSLSTNYI